MGGVPGLRFGYVIAELHRLRPLAVAAAEPQEGPANQQAAVQLAYLYQLASCVLTKVG